MVIFVHTSSLAVQSLLTLAEAQRDEVQITRSTEIVFPDAGEALLHPLKPLRVSRHNCVGVRASNVLTMSLGRQTSKIDRWAIRGRATFILRKVILAREYVYQSCFIGRRSKRVVAPFFVICVNRSKQDSQGLRNKK